MLERFLQLIVDALDWLYGAVLSPLVEAIGHGLGVLLLKPMALLHIPAAGQFTLLAALTAVFSMLLRRALKVDEKEEQFRRRFTELKMGQKPIDQLGDWKARDVLYRSSDKLIDEEYNTYLAQRFARQMLVYLLPVFCMLFWLESVFPETSLPLGGALGGSFPAVPGSLVFLTAYVVSLIALHQVRKRLQAKEQLPLPDTSG